MSTATATPPAKKAAKKADDATARKVNKIDPASVKVGDQMAIVNFVSVEAISHNGAYLKVRALEGEMTEPFKVEGAVLVENMLSADYFADTVSITGTEAEKIFGTAYNKPFTVNYLKQGDKKTGEGAGEERTLRGKLIDQDSWRGRSRCLDFDEVVANRNGTKKSFPLRWVDHRTIRWFILEGVKYEIK